MFAESRKFSFPITSQSKLSILTEPVGGALKVSIWVSKEHTPTRKVISGTVFKVNKDFSHKEILDAPYTHEEEGEASDLDLASYRVFKSEILTTMRSHLMRLNNSAYDRSSEASRVDLLLRIVSLGMRHPDEVNARRNLFKLVK